MYKEEVEDNLYKEEVEDKDFTYLTIPSYLVS